MLDFTTLLVVNLLVNGINFVAMALLWRRYRSRFDGLGWWTLGMAVHVPGIALILVRPHVPLFVPAVVANGLLMSSTVFMLMGFERFTGHVGRQTRNVVAFGVYLLLLTYFTAFVPSLDARTVCSSFFIVFVNTQTCWLLTRSVSARMRRITLYAGVLMGGYVAVSLLRNVILLWPFGPSGGWHSGLADEVAVISFIGLHICLILALALTIGRRLMDEVLANEKKFATAFELAPYGLVISRRENLEVVEVNVGFRGMFGYAHREVLGRPLTEILRPPSTGDETLTREAFIGAGRREKREIQTLRKSGEVMIGQLVSQDILIDGVDHLLSTIDDVTEESRLRQRLEELAATDALTGLPNRRSFYERFEFARLHAGRDRSRMAILSIDLDHFKQVNDTLGHSAGDTVLVEAARRLRESLRQVDVVARFGGDEFVVLLIGIHDPRDALQVAGKIVAAFRRPFEVQTRRLTLTASLGIAVYPDHGEGLDDLLKRSDEALYATKRAGRDGVTMTAFQEPE